MKKILLLFSLIVPLMFNGTTIVESKAEDLSYNNTNCGNPQNSIVRVLNKYDVFVSNGFVYKVDDGYSYIITSSNIEKKKEYKIYYQNGQVKNANVVGVDNYNGVVIIKTQKEDSIKPVCFADSNYIYKGQLNYAHGYYDNSKQFLIKTNLSQVGDFYTKKGYVNIYKSIIEIEGTEEIRGTAIFDELDRVIGMITSFNDLFEGGSFITESNKLLKIADSIVKTGKYNVNYIKYNLEDYSGLSSVVKKSYGVSKKVESGVVITTFKPFNYLFGGLNQGMVIVAVNGVKIKNKYELDKQLARYKKGDNVCLKVIKKDGKKAFYHVEV